jgi:integrase
MKSRRPRTHGPSARIPAFRGNFALDHHRKFQIPDLARLSKPFDECQVFEQALEIAATADDRIGIGSRRIDRKMQVDVTPHGFRSAFRDWAGDETHFPRELAEAALAHTVGDKAEQAYRRSDALEKRRELMAAWSAFVEPAP